MCYKKYQSNQIITTPIIYHFDIKFIQSANIGVKSILKRQAFQFRFNIRHRGLSVSERNKTDYLGLVAISRYEKFANDQQRRKYWFRPSSASMYVQGNKIQHKSRTLIDLSGFRPINYDLDTWQVNIKRVLWKRRHATKVCMQPQCPGKTAFNMAKKGRTNFCIRTSPIPPKAKLPVLQKK